MGSTVLFRMPSFSTGESLAMIVCVEDRVNEEHNRSTYDSLTICFRNKTKGGYETFDRLYYHRIHDTNIRQNHIWLSYVTSLSFEEMKVEEGDEIEVSTKAQGRIVVKKSAIHLLINS